MNHQNLDVHFSNVESPNPTIDKVKVYIAYPDRNRKKFDIPEKVFKDAEPTLKGCPIVGYYIKEIGDYGGHEGDRVKINYAQISTPEPHPIGYVADDKEPWTEEILQDNGEKKKYYVCEANLWTTRYPEAKRLLDGKNGQSMEVLFSGGIMQDGYFKPDAMQYIGLCALGEQVTATFEEASFKKFSDTFSQEFEEMMTEIRSEFAKGEDKSTPAKPEERIKGSDKNKEGSASTTRGGIKISEKTEKTLNNKVDEHNDKYKDEKGKKVTLGMLKAVYRRGAGAYSTSHRSNVSSRDQWAIARVNAFLKLVRSGKPSDSDYTQDNDLLPKGHSRKTSKMSIDWLSELVEEISEIYDYECTDDDIDDLYNEFACEHEEDFAVPKKYEGINFKPPVGVAKAAQRGLNLRAKQPDSNKCCTPVGLARARQLINRQVLSPSTIKRMKSYFDRHAVDKSGEGWGKDSKGYQAHLIWGGDAGYRWAKKVVGQMEKADGKAKMSDHEESEQIEDFAYKVEVSTDPDKKIEGNVGEKDVAAMKRKVLGASNKAEIIPKIFARHPEDLSGDVTQSELGYPLMSERDGVFYYNTGFIKAASSRIEQQKDQPYYEKVKANITRARKVVGMPEEFTFMEGGKDMDMEKMVMDMQKMAMKMFEQYGMRYMPYAMDDKYMYAMDMEKDMAKMMIPYAMMEDGEMAMDMEKMMAMDYEAKEMAIKTVMGMLHEKLEAMRGAEMGMMEKYSTVEAELKETKEKLAEFSETAKSFDEEKAKVLGDMISMKASLEEKDAKIEELETKNAEFSAKMEEVEAEKKAGEVEAILGKNEFSLFSEDEKKDLAEKAKDMNLEEFETDLRSKAWSKFTAMETFSLPEGSGLNRMGSTEGKTKEESKEQDGDMFSKIEE